MENTTKTLQIKNSGYYDSLNGKCIMLKEGDVLELVGVGEGDNWECLTRSGKTAFVEFENGQVSA